MYAKMIVILSAIFFIGLAYAAPAPKPQGALIAPVAPLAPYVAAAPAAVVTATSSQVFNRQINGIAAAPLVAAPTVAAPAVAPLAAPYIASPYVASPYSVYPYAAPFVSYV